MGHAKGVTHRYHSKEFKMAAVRKVISGHSSVEVAKELNVNDRLVRKWIEIYVTVGEKGLETKKRPGNPLAKYSSRQKK